MGSFVQICLGMVNEEYCLQSPVFTSIVLDRFGDGPGSSCSNWCPVENTYSPIYSVANSQRRWQLAADVSSQSAYIYAALTARCLISGKEGSIWWCFEAFSRS